jgi:hypothetical protein
MGTRRVKNVAMPEMPMMANVVSGGMCAKEASPPPHYEESRELFNEARRAIKRALAHAAAHDLTYDLSRAAKALQGLDF